MKRSQKISLKKIFFKFMNNEVSGKTMQNVRKHRDSNLSQQKEEETISCQN